ncbi:FHA domain-containing protein [Tautonia plasticadhaerens]|uniref:FHA domain protein n=1 Tax=Tautonia plasticadhaerens TaxID=2527974 RepID=A0A518H2R4_9BACT|nr:FHA domain-containing protein [Tautonia plasticadhaerens]QDV35110.1 FHA domain protein [Tautonia plasticadhaerens]
MGNVNQGGNSTMLGHWRVVLKQAEESAKAGRLDEALALAARADVADHRQAVQLRGKWTLELVKRAARRAEADDLDGALGDLDTAESFGAAPDVLAASRLKLADLVAEDLKTDLAAGEPDRAVDRIDAVGRRKVAGPGLRRLRESAEAWKAARGEARRGEFGVAADLLDRASRLAGSEASDALAAARRELEARQQAAAPKADRFYRTLSESADAWPAILAAAEDLLATVPEHPAARQARSRAWQQIGAIGPAVPSIPNRPPAAGNGEIRFLDESTPGPSPARAEPTAARPKSRHGGPHGRFLLWADVIGGYLVCLDDEVTLGRAGPDASADVQLLADLSRRHAVIARDGEHYTLRALHPTFVNGRAVDSAPLRDGDVIRLGSNVELEFRRPSPVTSTATLRLLSRHRPPMAVDGVLLMAQSCLVGPTRQCHVSAPRLKQPVVLFRQADALWCRCPGAFEVDGRPALSRAPLTTSSSVKGEGFSFSLEPVEPRGAALA